LADLLKCPGLLEQMGCTWDDGEVRLASEACLCLPVELEYYIVGTANDEKGRGPDLCQARRGEVGAASPRDDGCDL
jgi:hypothetical protein